MKNNVNKYSWQGMLIVSVLGIAGILILFFTGCFNITNYDELYTYLCANIFPVVCSLFFIGITIYCWISFFRNIILKPKKDILYLLKIENGIATFIDRKGKTFLFPNCKFASEKYYYVLKTRDNIKEIIEESFETFMVPKEKKSYWLNFYSPMGKFEKLFILPIVYVILIPGIFSVIMTNGFEKIFSIIFISIPGYFIIYDFIYKIKLKNGYDEKTDDDKLENSYFMFISSIQLLCAIVISLILLNMFFEYDDSITRIILSPFCLCALCFAGYFIAQILNIPKMTMFFLKSFIMIFLLFWFGILIFLAIKIVEQENDYKMALFTIPFWIFGIFIFYYFIIKKK